MGRPRKSADQHKVEGTYRADRHEEKVIPMTDVAVVIKPSVHVPKSVHPEWTITMRRLADMGIVIDADLPLLESAFVLLADSRYYHDLMDKVKESIDEGEEVEEGLRAMVALNGMYIKAVTLFASISSKFAITPSERAKILHVLPKKKDDTKKKSINSILARKK